LKVEMLHILEIKMPQVLEKEKSRILEIEMPHKLEKNYAAHPEQHVI